MILRKKTIEEGIFSFKIKITVSSIIAVLGIALIMAFIYFQHHRDVFVFSTAVVGGLAAVYSAFYVAQTLKFNLQRNKLRCTAEILLTIGGIELHRVRTFIIKNLEFDKTSASEVHNKIMDNDELYHAVTTVLGQFEDISIFIQKDVLDEELLYLSLYHMIPFFYESLKPHIEEVRIMYKDNGIFIELEKLSKSWKSERYLNSGKQAIKIV